MFLYENFSDSPEQRKKLTLYQEQLETGNFYHIETEIERTANNLGLTAIGLEKKISQISGGQRAKVILAKLLLEKPDVLLLDEPTNFLDKEHINWLGDYLSTMIINFWNAYPAVSAISTMGSSENTPETILIFSD
jgi:ATPase subunit of ABC transporter with duplicated ATPase domains